MNHGLGKETRLIKRDGRRVEWGSRTHALYRSSMPDVVNMNDIRLFADIIPTWKFKK